MQKSPVVEAHRQSSKYRPWLHHTDSFQHTWIPMKIYSMDGKNWFMELGCLCGAFRNIRAHPVLERELE